MKFTKSEIYPVFKDTPAVTRTQILEYLRSHRPDISEKHRQWAIFDLCRDKLIRKVSRNEYMLFDDAVSMDKTEYFLFETVHCTTVRSFLDEQFPLLEFAVWETYTLNEFLNHQLGRDHIFVEVEKPCEVDAFYALREQVEDPVLYKPTGDEIFLYSGELTIIISTLTTEAPVTNHMIKLEKLLVDLLANKLVGQIISPGEIPDIFDMVCSQYFINRSTLFRYARRRGLEKEILERISA